MGADDLGLAGAQAIRWQFKGAQPGLVPNKVVMGSDAAGMGLQIAAATWSGSGEPPREALKSLHAERQGKRLFPLVVVAHNATTAWVYGPSADAQTITMPIGQATRVLQAALDEPNGLAARQRLGALQKAASTGQRAGVVNQGLFAGHYLATSAPHRPDWAAATNHASPMLPLRHEELVRALGFTIHQSGEALVLNDGKAPRGVAVLLEDAEQFDAESQRFGISPVAYGLSTATRHEVPWLVVLRGSQIRLYPAKPGVGVGQKGQADTWFEMDLAVVDEEQAALLPLVFSAAALAADGSTQQLLDGSAQFAVELGARLRDRVYDQVIPSLSQAVAAQLPALGIPVDAAGLDLAYRLTMRILFRLLFQAYAEDRGLLPYGRNAKFDAHSLKEWAMEYIEDPGQEFTAASSAIWSDRATTWGVIDGGDPDWDVPAYNGGLFGLDEVLNPEGYLLSRMKLSNATMGPVLAGLLVDSIEEGSGTGAVDFRSLSVREFGTIYEGLLESALSVAPSDLSVDKELRYVPAKPGDEVVVAAGGVYFHSSSGQRKSTGTYFTPHIVVEHLLTRSLDPVLDDHLARIKALLDSGDGASAAASFFDFRVADLSMGSAHFLTAAIDHIEARMRDFLTENPIPAVQDELRTLMVAAEQALGDDASAVADIDAAALLRRQIARRCIYGLDINPMAVELARLAIWITTFVPGLPMSSLDHTLVCANSLTGVGTVDEAVEALDPSAAQGGQISLFADAIDSELLKARELLLDAANASEATKADVTRSAELARAAKAAAEPARVLFDAVVAGRLGLLTPTAYTDAESLIAATSETVIAHAVAAVDPAHFPFLFPEVFLRVNPGFDVLVGNPPWDKLRHEPQQFWGIRDPGLHALKGRARMARIEVLRSIDIVGAREEKAEVSWRESLASAIKPAFKYQKSQHYDLAKLFAERNAGLVNSLGAVGLVLPQASLVLGGWAPVRQWYISRGRLHVQPLRNSGGWVFPEVHGQMTIVLMVLSPGKGVVVNAAVSSRTEFLAPGSESGVGLSAEELLSLSDEACIPWFEHRASPPLFLKMSQQPKLGSGTGWIRARADSTRWDFSGSGPHKGFTGDASSPDAWRVTMTRHVDAYAMTNDLAGLWIPSPESLVALGKGVELDAGSAVLSRKHPAIVYRFPTNNDNSRTLIASALPSSGWLYSKGYVHGVASDEADPTELLALLGYLNSIVADWWARRFVDRHVGKRIIEGLPLPDWSIKQRQEVAGIAAELSCRGGVRTMGGYGDVSPFAVGLGKEMKVELLARIDVAACRGFGMDMEDLEVLAADFSEKPDALPASYRDQLRRSMANEDQ